MLNAVECHGLVSVSSPGSLRLHQLGMAEHLMLIDEDSLGCVIDKLMHGAEARPAAAVSLARTCVDARRKLSIAVAAVKMERVRRFRAKMGTTDFASKQIFSITTGWWTEAEVRLAKFMLGESSPCRITHIRCQGPGFHGTAFRRCTAAEVAAQGDITSLLIESLSIAITPLIRTLKFDSIHVCDSAIDLLRSSGVLGRLESLSLVNCLLGRESAASLGAAFEEQCIHHLEVLELNNNPDMGDEGVTAIAAHLPPRLALLGFAHCSCGDKAVNQICRLAMERKLLGLRVLDLSGNGAISNSSLRLVGHVLLKHRESVLSLEIVGLCGGAEVHKSTFLAWLVLQLICIFKKVTLWWPTPVYAGEHGFGDGPGNYHAGAFRGIDYEVNYPYVPAQTSIPIPNDLLHRG